MTVEEKPKLKVDRLPWIVLEGWQTSQTDDYTDMLQSDGGPRQSSSNSADLDCVRDNANGAINDTSLMSSYVPYTFDFLEARKKANGSQHVTETLIFLHCL